MKSVLKRCFGSDRSILFTALSVPALVIALSLLLELLQLCTVIVVAVSTGAGCVWASVLYFAGRYYFEHKEGSEDNDPAQKV